MKVLHPFGWIDRGTEAPPGRYTRVTVLLEPGDHPADAEALAQPLGEAVARAANDYEPVKAAGGTR